MKLLLTHEPPLLKQPVLTGLWQLCGRSLEDLPAAEAARQLRCSLTLISMAAPHRPTTVSNLDLLLKVRTWFISPVLHICRPTFTGER